MRSIFAIRPSRAGSAFPRRAPAMFGNDLGRDPASYTQEAPPDDDLQSSEMTFDALCSLQYVNKFNVSHPTQERPPEDDLLHSSEMTPDEILRRLLLSACPDDVTLLESTFHFNHLNATFLPKFIAPLKVSDGFRRWREQREGPTKDCGSTTAKSMAVKKPIKGKSHLVTLPLALLIRAGVRIPFAYCITEVLLERHFNRKRKQ